MVGGGSHQPVVCQFPVVIRMVQLCCIPLCSFFQLNFWDCPKWKKHHLFWTPQNCATWKWLNLVTITLIKLCWSSSRFCPQVFWGFLQGSPRVGPFLPTSFPLPFPYFQGILMGVVWVVGVIPLLGCPWKFPRSNIPFSLASTASETLSGWVFFSNSMREVTLDDVFVWAYDTFFVNRKWQTPKRGEAEEILQQRTTMVFLLPENWLSSCCLNFGTPFSYKRRYIMKCIYNIYIYVYISIHIWFHIRIYIYISISKFHTLGSHVLKAIFNRPFFQVSQRDVLVALKKHHPSGSQKHSGEQWPVDPGYVCCIYGIL